MYLLRGLRHYDLGVNVSHNWFRWRNPKRLLGDTSFILDRSQTYNGRLYLPYKFMN